VRDDYAKQQLDAGQVHFHRDTVESLLTENERLRARNEFLVRLVEILRLRAENERLRSVDLQERIIIADQSKEIERLRREVGRLEAEMERLWVMDEITPAQPKEKP
jgi:cell division protein FtsB